MNFKKQTLLKAGQGYFIKVMNILGENRIAAAPEANAPAYIFTAPDFKPQMIAEEPGGCMGFAPVPGKSDALFMITEFYPIFKSEKAGIHYFQAVDGLNTPWQGNRIIDLPFVHRITVVSNGSNSFLIAATVCGGKDYQDDWSKPGAVYAVPIPTSLSGAQEESGPSNQKGNIGGGPSTGQSVGPARDWKLMPVIEGLHKNHGMNNGTYNEKPCVYITGTEGLFVLYVPEAGRGGHIEDWKYEKLIDTEISEVFPADLDGDGVDELAVIEPFHGNAMSVYKRTVEAAGHGRGSAESADPAAEAAGPAGRNADERGTETAGETTWEKIFSAELGFGHGLWAGTMAGKPVVIAGNRSGEKNLACFETTSTGPFTMKESAVDHGSGTTNMDVITTPHGEALAASNQGHEEYALYWPEK